MMRATKVSDRDNPILKSVLQGNYSSTVKDTAPSPAVSEEYETAKEDLSDNADTLGGDDDKFYSLCDESSPPTRTSTSLGERSRPLSSSKKAQRRNGEISASGLLEDSIEKSGICTVLREITGYFERSDEDGSLFNDTAAKSRRCARMRTGTHSRSYAKERRRIPITSILQCQPVVKLTKVPLSQRQRERAKKRMMCESNSGSAHIPRRSVMKLPSLLSATSSDEGVENDGEVAMETGDSGGGYIIDSLTDIDTHSDDHQESPRPRAKEILETPKLTKPFIQRSLSLTLSKKRTPDNKFTTPKLRALSKTVQPASSAKRKLQLENRIHQKGSKMNSSQFWSSDSDFDNMPLSQQKSRSSTLVKQSTLVQKSNTPTAANATTPTGPKRRKILSSFSSEDEEIIPSFLQKQKAEKAAQIKERGERSLLVNGGTFDSGDDGVKGSEDPLSDLKSTKKLGKYEKSPAGRGKEKAKSKSSGLPSKINCAACNKNLYWQTKKIHSHPRLSVLVCITCHQKFNQGTFMVDEDNEIYCTLCGDGGNLVLCSFCQHSFCQECIKRLSGEEHLDYLLSSDDVDFKCYVCDPKDIEPLQELCDEVCYYFRAHSSQEKKKKEYKSDKYVIDSDSSTARSRETSTDGQEGGNGGGMNGFSGGWGFGSETSQGGKEGESSKRRGRSGGKKADEQREQKQHEDSSDKGSRSSAPRGGRGGGRETRNSSKSRRQEDSKRGKDRRGAEKGSSRRKRGGRRGTTHTGGDSSSDSMSDVGESSEVNTDEISLSDSSLFEDVGVRKKDRKKVSERERRRMRRRGSEEGSGVDENKDREPGKTTKRKKKRITVGHLHDSLLHESDIESSHSGDVNQPLPPKERKKRRKEHSSSDSGSKPSRKRGRLGSTLSSGSDDDQQRLAITVSDSETGGAKEGYDSSNGLFDDGMMSKGGEGSQSVKYCTPIKLNARKVTDSSDSDVVPLKRTSKKEAHRKALGSDSSGAEKKVEGTKKKTRSKKRKKRGSGRSSEDFVSDDLSLRGPRLNNRHKRLRLASFLSSESSTSSSSSSDEDSSGKKRERKGKEKKKAESDKPTTPNTPGHKRKNIRKLIADEKLAQTTKAAQREEEERLERLKQKAKLLAPIQDSERVILEQDPSSKRVKVGILYYYLDPTYNKYGDLIG